MSTTLADIFSERRLLLIIRWERGLRELGVTSPLAHPDILLYRMEDTLAAVIVALSAPALAENRACCPAVATLRGSCRCGLNPLQSYFESGSRVVSELFDDLSADERRRLEHAWFAVAQREIAVLCSLCQQEPRR
jgi:hypothetical protein